MHVWRRGKEAGYRLDERLGILKEHTPGLQYILSGFTAREVYQGSLDWFHQIFRPDGEGFDTDEKGAY